MNTRLRLTALCALFAGHAAIAAEPGYPMIMEEVIVTAKHPYPMIMEEVVVTAKRPPATVVEEAVVTAERSAARPSPAVLEEVLVTAPRPVPLLATLDANVTERELELSAERIASDEAAPEPRRPTLRF
jgi:hypothetical protein